jgi:desampylase
MGSVITMSTALLKTLLAEAAASPAAEVCGLLFGTDERIEAAEPCRNVAPDPARFFEIDPVCLLAAHRRARNDGPAIVGHYHSHPKGLPVPSPADAAAATPEGAVWLILGGGEAQAWRAVPDGARHGRFDPVTITLA